MQEEKIDASPTKQFFINSIIADIYLIDVIPDLVDNCYDGALRLGKKDDLKEFEAVIQFDKDHFFIKDNCGGITKENAKNYAFRFGRNDDFPPIPNSRGEFGIGMKRAIFKLGKKAIIESKTEDDHFVIEIDVEQWKKTKEWEFPLKKISDSESPHGMKKNGLAITVKQLHDNVTEAFGSDLFEKRLSMKLETANSVLLEKGFNIILNNKPLGYEPIKFLYTNKLNPGYKKLELNIGDDQVDVEIYVGLGERSPDNAGWYIFCNGRLVLEADKTKQTGWNEKEMGVPKYHNDYAYFRGLALFTSKNTSLLPWDTTKTRIDIDAGIYKATKLEMIKLARPVISFLKKVANEKAKDEEGQKPEYTPLNDEINKAVGKSIPTLSLKEANFKEPKVEKEKPGMPQMTRVSYYVLLEKINKVKKILKVRTNKEIGQKTFDYFYEHEVEGE